MRKSKDDNHDDFQFLSEKPKDSDLLFGHKEIVITLEKVVIKSPESFTIGLYGDWGSGKSSVAETLQRELEKKNIPLVIFDVWKHEGDALRRTFIKETHHFFMRNTVWKKKYSGKDDWLDDLSKSIKSTKKKPLKIWSTIRIVGIFILSASLLPIIAWVLLDKLFGVIDLKRNDLIGSVIALISLFPIGFLTKFVINFIESIKGEKVEYYQDKIQDPIEFENKFKDLIKNLANDIKKVVFVFDNLDRVSGEKAVQIMSTIKTFLDPIDKAIKDKNIVFIVPCDEKAIKRHLRKTLNYSKDFRGDEYHRYASEYLRKFFNTILWVPEFYVNELEELARKKLEETLIPAFRNEELSALIVQVFDKNPRQIIQFINILISNYLLVKERPIEGFSLEEDIAKLAKYLLLIQKFPDIMEVYRMEMIYNLEETPVGLRERVDGVPRFSTFRVTEFDNFLKKTDHVRIDSLNLFFKLRRSIYESKLPKSFRLFKLIQANRLIDLVEEDKESIQMKSDIDKSDYEFLVGLELETKTKEFSEIVIEKLRRVNNPILLANFIDGLLLFLHFKNFELNQKAYFQIYKKLKQFDTNISDITPQLLIDLCNNNLNESNRSMFNKIISTNHINDFVHSHSIN